MGLHRGTIAAEAPADELISAMNTHVSTLVPGAPVARFDDLVIDADDGGWSMAYGERAGVSYIVDPSMVLSLDADLIVDLSRQLDTVVAGFGAETVSGSYWFTAARSGAVLRAYFFTHSDMSEPWSVGRPLASEAAQPFDADLDGIGLDAAARELGFAELDWLNAGPFRALRYEAHAFPQRGPLGKRLELFHQEVRLPPDRRPGMTVVMRSAPASGTGKRGSTVPTAVSTVMRIVVIVVLGVYAVGAVAASFALGIGAAALGLAIGWVYGARIAAWQDRRTRGPSQWPAIILMLLALGTLFAPRGGSTAIPWLFAFLAFAYASVFARMLRRLLS